MQGLDTDSENEECVDPDKVTETKSEESAEEAEGDNAPNIKPVWAMEEEEVVVDSAKVGGGHGQRWKYQFDL